jgi:hypothetical protein
MSFPHLIAHIIDLPIYSFVIRSSVYMGWYLNDQDLYLIESNDKINYTRSVGVATLLGQYPHFKYQSPPINDLFHLKLSPRLLSSITILHSMVTVHISRTNTFPFSDSLKLSLNLPTIQWLVFVLL